MSAEKPSMPLEKSAMAEWVQAARDSAPAAFVGAPASDVEWARAEPKRAHWGVGVSADRMAVHSSGGGFGVICLWGEDDDPLLPRPLSWSPSGSASQRGKDGKWRGGEWFPVFGEQPLDVPPYSPLGREALAAVVVAAYGAQWTSMLHRQIAAFAIASTKEVGRPPRRDAVSPSPESVEALAVEVAAFFRRLGETNDPSGDWRALRVRLENPARLRATYLEALAELGAEGQNQRKAASAKPDFGDWIVLPCPPPSGADVGGFHVPAAGHAARCLWLDRVAPRIKREEQIPAMPRVVAREITNAPQSLAESGLMAVPAFAMTSKDLGKWMQSKAFMCLLSWIGRTHYAMWKRTGDVGSASVINCGSLSSLAVACGFASVQVAEVSGRHTKELRIALDAGARFRISLGDNCANVLWSWSQSNGHVRVTVGEALKADAVHRLVGSDRLLVPYADPLRAPGPAGSNRLFGKQLAADQALLILAADRSINGRVERADGRKWLAWPFTRDDVAGVAGLVGLSKPDHAIALVQRWFEGDKGKPRRLPFDGESEAGGPMLVEAGSGVVRLAPGWEDEDTFFQEQARRRQQASKAGKASARKRCNKLR